MSITERAVGDREILIRLREDRVLGGAVAGERVFRCLSPTQAGVEVQELKRLGGGVDEAETTLGIGDSTLAGA